MKSIKFISMLLALTFVSFAFTACDDDDDKTERPDYTKVKYTCSFGADFLDFYDVVATYTDIDGRERVERLTQRNWQYEGRKDGTQTGMRCNIVATLKSMTPDLSPTQFDLTYSHTLYYYTKKTSAIEEKPEMGGDIISKENINTYLTNPNMQTLVIMDFNSSSLE